MKKILFSLLPFTTFTSVVASEFEKPVALKADGEFIRAEKSGYASPCLADITGDGKKDLLVGQFDEGKIKVYPGLGDGKFGKGDWLQADGEIAKVAGIW